MLKTKNRGRVRFDGRLLGFALLTMACLFQGTCAEVGSGGVSLLPNYLPAPLPILLGILLQ